MANGNIKYHTSQAQRCTLDNNRNVMQVVASGDNNGHSQLAT